jgi:sugar fermentation stimulation protein A
MKSGIEDADVPEYVRDGPLIRAALISRPNRFLAVARLDGGFDQGAADEMGPHVVEAHIADPGRLEELLVPNARVYLSRARAGKGRVARKTVYDLVLVERDGVLVSVDSRVPNELVYRALQSGFFEELRGYTQITRESVYGSSRLDFRLSPASAAALAEPPGAGPLPDCFVEVKSATLVQGGMALFPDAPTSRGARHMRELAMAISQGFRAIVIFVVQRVDAVSFAPNVGMDPAFARALRDGVTAGVEIIAVRCDIARSGAIVLDQRIPVIVGDPVVADAERLWCEDIV